MRTGIVLTIVLIAVAASAQTATPTRTPTQTPGPTIAVNQCCECPAGALTGCKDWTTNVGSACQASLLGGGATPPCAIFDGAICGDPTGGFNCVTYTPTNTPTPTHTNTFTPTPTNTPGSNCAIFQMTSGHDGFAQNDCDSPGTWSCIGGNITLDVERDDCAPSPDYQQQAMMDFDTMGVIPVGSTITSGFLRVSSNFSSNDGNVNIQGDWIGGIGGCSPSDFTYSAGHGALNVPLSSVCPNPDGCCPLASCAIAQSIDFALGDLGSIVNLTHPRLRIHLDGSPIGNSNFFAITSWDGEQDGDGPREALGLCWNPPATDTPGGINSPTRTPTPSFTPTRTPTQTFTQTPTVTPTPTCGAIQVLGRVEEGSPTPIASTCMEYKIPVGHFIPGGNRQIVVAISTGPITAANSAPLDVSVTDTQANIYRCFSMPAGAATPSFSVSAIICRSVIDGNSKLGTLVTSLSTGDNIIVTHPNDCDTYAQAYELELGGCYTSTYPKSTLFDCINRMSGGGTIPDQAPYRLACCDDDSCSCGHPGCVICGTPNFGTVEFAPAGTPAIQLDHIFFIPVPDRVPCNNIGCTAGCGDFVNQPTNYPCCHKTDDSLCNCNDGLGCYNFSQYNTRQLSLNDGGQPANCFANTNPDAAGNFHIATMTVDSAGASIEWIQGVSCVATNPGCSAYQPTFDRTAIGTTSFVSGDAFWDSSEVVGVGSRQASFKYSAPSDLPKFQGFSYPTPGVFYAEQELGLYPDVPLGVPTDTPPAESPTPTPSFTETPTNTPALHCHTRTPTPTVPRMRHNMPYFFE